MAPEALLQGLEAQRQARRDQVPQFGLQALRRQLRARRQDARAAAHGVQRLEAGPQRPELASLPELLVRLKLAMPPHARLRRARERVEVLHLRVRRGAGGLEDAEHVDELRRVEVLQLSAEASLLRATCSGNEPSLSAFCMKLSRMVLSTSPHSIQNVSFCMKLSRMVLSTSPHSIQNASFCMKLSRMVLSTSQHSIPNVSFCMKLSRMVLSTSPHSIQNVSFRRPLGSVTVSRFWSYS